MLTPDSQHGALSGDEVMTGSDLHRSNPGVRRHGTTAVLRQRCLIVCHRSLTVVFGGREPWGRCAEFFVNRSETDWCPRQNASVITNIGVIVSALVSVGALTVSFIAHRHQVDRARVLDLKERRLEASERLLTQRQALADRQTVLAQASMIDVRVVGNPSILVDGLTTSVLKITNRSSQPVSALSAWMTAAMTNDVPINDVPEGLAAASSRSFPLPLPSYLQSLPTAEITRLFVFRVAFTDAAGIHWLRDDSGGLHEGSRLDSGGWWWGPREGPPVVEAMPPSATRPAPRAMTGCASRLLPAAALVLLITVVWIVFFR